MNDERSDLADLRRELARVENDLFLLNKRASLLEDRIAARELSTSAPPVIASFRAPAIEAVAAAISAPAIPDPEPAAALPQVIPQERLDKYFKTAPALEPTTERIA